MTFSQAQLDAAEHFILLNRKNLSDKPSTIPREVWLVAAAIQEERERCANIAVARSEHHRDYCEPECKCANGWHIALEIRSPSSDPKRRT